MGSFQSALKKDKELLLQTGEFDLHRDEALKAKSQIRPVPPISDSAHSKPLHLLQTRGLYNVPSQPGQPGIAFIPRYQWKYGPISDPDKWTLIKDQYWNGILGFGQIHSRYVKIQKHYFLDWGLWKFVAPNFSCYFSCLHQICHNNARVFCVTVIGQSHCYRV